MRLLVTYLSILLIPFLTTSKSTTVVISNDSKLTILGYTNINTFECQLDFQFVNPTLDVGYEQRGKKISFRNANLKIANSCFDCGKKMMNKDFLKLLKTKQYPNIEILLNEIDLISQQQALARVQLKIAGRKKEITVPIKISNEQHLSVQGCMDVKLSDFELEAPRKMLGLVVVSDAIEIHFDLNIKNKEIKKN
ncbi:YceI family protein [Tenacibaculum tangerinum]|uniref:YceI family protein n=1 Tax=Tenacibaculum tangerinum TaxID=3038772 RepID=A0ABY8L3E3_9FLAO|nr:YceI family protein [Tenacibaculum tangerinum]WGH75954.1 YceI family protein [Tenacibaculum tangerinum]